MIGAITLALFIMTSILNPVSGELKSFGVTKSLIISHPDPSKSDKIFKLSC
jgi:hypothetical protein